MCNKLVECIEDDTFKIVMKLTVDLSLQLVTQHQLPEEEQEIDLSDMEDVPLTMTTKFSTHKTLILEEKDWMFEHKSFEDRIE